MRRADIREQSPHLFGMEQIRLVPPDRRGSIGRHRPGAHGMHLVAAPQQRCKAVAADKTGGACQQYRLHEEKSG